MDAFISYRREGGFEFSARLHERLGSLHYYTFFDVENMQSGEFDKQLFQQIESCPNFILVLPPNGFDRCKNEGDWVRLEIAHALKLKKNIILILLPGFDFPESLPDDIKDIKKYQGVQYYNWNFAQTVEKVISYLKDENGKPLELIKKKRENNVYYNNAGISKQEAKRMRDEMYISSLIEKPFLQKALEGRSHLVGFCTSIYGAEMTKEYFSHPAFDKVFVTLASEGQRAEIEQLFNADENHKIYDPISNTEEINELLDRILQENHLNGIDFAYLNLALMDAEDPLTRLRVIRDHLNDGGIIFIREIDDSLITAFPDPRGDFEKAISMISDDKYAGNRRIGREVYTLLHLVGAKEIYRCPELLTTVGMSQRNKERTFNAWFGYEIAEFKALLEEEPDNLLYKNNLQWYEDHLENMEKEFLRDDFFFSNGFNIYYAIFSEDD